MRFAADMKSTGHVAVRFPIASVENSSEFSHLNSRQKIFAAAKNRAFLPARCTRETNGSLFCKTPIIGVFGCGTCPVRSQAPEGVC